MSQAFVKEEDSQWLHEIPPTLTALINYLSKENNGIRVYLKRQFLDSKGLEIFEMSNGLNYSKDNGQWQITN
ncbi:hypothetical protein [Ferruginibacter albus]|uniref:hypothetical protein n=1 Tax=Ferruginibacter albus TaxID=2875540 RepID=UPI001CC6CAFC|nr:hypothetical protein [Ferruginibacter albus]UAY53062.1 hypothetical protein K9M53_05135 [Ferruginibacter albus]